MSQEYLEDDINSEYGLEEIMPIDDNQDFDYSINFVEDDIKGNISILPIDIQKRIYIFTFKKYWISSNNCFAWKVKWGAIGCCNYASIS